MHSVSCCAAVVCALASFQKDPRCDSSSGPLSTEFSCFPCVWVDCSPDTNPNCPWVCESLFNCVCTPEAYSRCALSLPKVYWDQFLHFTNLNLIKWKRSWMDLWLLQRTCYHFNIFSYTLAHSFIHSHNIDASMQCVRWKNEQATFHSVQTCYMWVSKPTLPIIQTLWSEFSNCLTVISLQLVWEMCLKFK